MPAPCPTALSTRLATCASLLARAAQLVDRRDFGGRLQGLVHAASDVLDDVDGLLLARHPVLHAAEFAAVACLHRQLEAVQAGIPDRLRTRPAPYAPRALDLDLDAA